MKAAPESTDQSDGPDNESDHVQFGIMATTNISFKQCAKDMYSPR